MLANRGDGPVFVFDLVLDVTTPIPPLKGAHSRIFNVPVNKLIDPNTVADVQLPPPWFRPKSDKPATYATADRFPPVIMPQVLARAADPNDDCYDLIIFSENDLNLSGMRDLDASLEKLQPKADRSLNTIPIQGWLRFYSIHNSSWIEAPQKLVAAVTFQPDRPKCINFGPPSPPRD